MSSIRRIAGLVVVAALSGCAGAPAESRCGPPPSIGDYDRARFEDALGVELEAEVESNGRLSHEYVVEGNFHFGFEVDPDVNPDAVVRAWAHIDDGRFPLTEQEQAMEDAWFALVAAAQPEAADWMRDELATYLPRTGELGSSTTLLEASDGTCVRVRAGRIPFAPNPPSQPDHRVSWEITTDL